MPAIPSAQIAPEPFRAEGNGSHIVKSEPFCGSAVASWCTQTPRTTTKLHQHRACKTAQHRKSGPVPCSLSMALCPICRRKSL
eukprot:5183482-Amphidinium_carterae.1